MTHCFLTFAAGDEELYNKQLREFKALQNWLSTHAEQYGLATDQLDQLDDVGKETLAAVYPEPVSSFEPPASLDLPPVRISLSESAGLTKTVNNFIELVKHEKKLVSKQRSAQPIPLQYQGCKVFRIEKDFALQTGDMTRQDGSGGESIYGGSTFNDDKEGLKTSFEYGTVAMANSGKNSNTSQFFITLTKDSARLKKLTGKYVAFGKVDTSDAGSVESLDRLNQLGSAKGSPTQPVWIKSCGML
ncbi:hypothetical protein OIO90_005234 [Microbotryomycetes sp. JL221]|nr:hypothetical protein OIO90_005234 [Microbotryomycetes sp. JL221]